MTGVIAPNLLAVGMVGTDSPRIALGVANGLQQWIPLVQVTTTDTGSLGVGTNVPLPLPIPQPVLFAALMGTVPAAGIVGVMMPLFVTGLSNGMSLAFLQMLVTTTHPVIGSGTGVAKFLAPSCAGPMIAGFTAAGLVGEAMPRLAGAIGLALDSVFASLAIPIVIVGTASPTGGAGTGTGKIL